MCSTSGVILDGRPQPGRLQIVSISLYFFMTLTTALLLTINPSSLKSLTIEVDLYPNPENKHDSLLLVTTVYHLASYQINYDVQVYYAHAHTECVTSIVIIILPLCCVLATA